MSNQPCGWETWWFTAWLVGWTRPSPRWRKQLRSLWLGAEDFVPFFGLAKLPCNKNSVFFVLTTPLLRGGKLRKNCKVMSSQPFNGWSTVRWQQKTWEFLEESQWDGKGLLVAEIPKRSPPGMVIKSVVNHEISTTFTSIGELIPDFWLPSTGRQVYEQKNGWLFVSLRDLGISPGDGPFWDWQTGFALRHGAARREPPLWGGGGCGFAFDFAETPTPLEDSPQLTTHKIQTEPVKSHWNQKKQTSHEKDNEAKTCQTF